VTLDQMLAAAQERLGEALAARKAAQEALVALRSKDDLAEDDVVKATTKRDNADHAVDVARAEVTKYETEIAREAELDDLATRTQAGAPRPQGGARTTSEPEVYRKGGEHSYFRDLFNGTIRNQRSALERLERNDKQKIGRAHV